MTHWIKSSYSSAGNDACIEVRLTPAIITIRDSKSPTAGHVSLNPAAWASFLHAARTNQSQ